MTDAELAEFCRCLDGPECVAPSPGGPAYHGHSHPGPFEQAVAVSEPDPAGLLAIGLAFVVVWAVIRRG